MSNKANPVALTSAMMMDRSWVITLCGPMGGCTRSPQRIASLSSNLHRLAPACVAQTIVERDGEWRGDELYTCTGAGRDEWMRRDVANERRSKRLGRRLSTLNRQLEPLALRAVRGDGLYLESTDPTRPLPTNGPDAGKWQIEGRRI